MTTEDKDKLAPILAQLLDDPPLAIRCISGQLKDTKVVVVFQKGEDGEINPVVLSKAQLAHINQLAQEHL